MLKIDNFVLQQYVANKILATGNQEFVADKILPRLEVDTLTGKIPKWGENHMRSYRARRSAGDTSMHYIPTDMGTPIAYDIQDYDLSNLLEKKLVDESSVPYDILSMAGIMLAQTIKLQRDLGLAEILTNTSVLTKNVTLSASTDKWTDTVNSVPVTNIETAKTSVLTNTGFEANTMVLSYSVANALRVHPSYLNYFSQGVVPGGMSTNSLVEILKTVHGFDEVIIAKTTKITSQLGQTVTKAFAFGNDCVVFHKPKSGNILTPSFGYSFLKKGAPEVMVQSWFDESTKKAYNVEASMSFDDQIMMPESGYLIKSAV